MKKINNKWKRGSSALKSVILTSYMIIFISIFTIGFIFIVRYDEKPYNDFIKDKDANCVIIDKTAPVNRSNLYMLVLKCDNSKEKDKLFKKPITMEEYYQYEIGEPYK